MIANQSTSIAQANAAAVLRESRLVTRIISIAEIPVIIAALVTGLVLNGVFAEVRGRDLNLLGTIAVPIALTGLISGPIMLLKTLLQVQTARLRLLTDDQIADDNA